MFRLDKPDLTPLFFNLPCHQNLEVEPLGFECHPMLNNMVLCNILLCKEYGGGHVFSFVVDSGALVASSTVVEPHCTQ